MIVPPIIIDTTDLMSQYTSLTKDDIETMLDNVAKGLAATYANKLELQAQESLHQTKQMYISSIKVVDSGKMEGTVMLDYSKNPLVRMIEEGADPFDMKTAMLNSPKAKVTKKGIKYLTIPFRWGVPGTMGESTAFAGIMPAEVHKVVKSKPADIPVSGGGSRSAGISLKEIPEQFRVKKIRPAIVDKSGNELFKAYENKNTVYEGITKTVDAATGQNTYGSFRRVSENSDANAWIHPGIEKYNLMQKALGAMDLEGETGTQLDIALSKLGLI